MVVMSHKGQLLVVTVFALAVVASGQAQKTTHTTTVCHDLVVRVSEIRFDKPNTSTTEEMEQALRMLALLGVALIGYKMERHPFVWSHLQSRFRLKGMNIITWLWTIALSVFMFGGRFSVPIAFAIALVAVLLEDRPIQRRMQLLGGLTSFLLLSLVTKHLIA